MTFSLDIKILTWMSVGKIEKNEEMKNKLKIKKL